MRNEIIYNYEPLWGDWKVEKIIGQGSIGNVYKVSRDLFGKKQYSAVKVMNIPTEEQYNMYVSTLGHSSNSKNFFEDLAKQIANEITLLYELKGHGNIIAYEDHMIKNVDDKWHILIRMEYAKCLSEYFNDRDIGRKEVLKLGIDISRALEFCHSKGIMHRDVKEGNIFVSLNADSYKLGDFSVSKESNSLTMAQTKVGTLNYMPPEIVNGQSYNKNVDLYSLGLVLYKYLNKGRLPFLPDYPNPVSYIDLEQSYIKRLHGDEMPKPINSRDDISAIVLKACSHNSTDRYQNAEDLRRDIEKIYYNLPENSQNYNSMGNIQQINSKNSKPDINMNVINSENINIKKINTENGTLNTENKSVGSYEETVDANSVNSYNSKSGNNVSQSNGYNSKNINQNGDDGNIQSRTNQNNINKNYSNQSYNSFNTNLNNNNIAKNNNMSYGTSNRTNNVSNNFGNNNINNRNQNTDNNYKNLNRKKSSLKITLVIIGIIGTILIFSIAMLIILIKFGSS